MLVLLRRSRLVRLLAAPMRLAGSASIRASAGRLPRPSARVANALASPVADRAWVALVALMALWATWRAGVFVATEVTPAEVARAFGLGAITLLRVVVLIAVSSLVWVPIGVWLGQRPRLARVAQPLAQFLAAFPANLLFPVFVVVIVRERLSADVWLSPLMVLGTQWYILFNVVAGASTFPSELRDAAINLRLRGWLWWRKVMLPAVFPYYLTGVITAAGGSWNASIVAEYATWGDTRLEASGIGSYIAAATAAGDQVRVVLGTAVMCVFVIALNRLLWRPLYRMAERRLRIG
jgi:NitT/TauT family transport system permease protein